MNANINQEHPADVFQILDACTRANIRFAIEGDNLRLRLPETGVDDWLLATIRSNKAAILDALRQTKFSAPVDAAKIIHISDRDHVPLSFAQESLWLAEQLSDTHGMFNFCAVLSLQGQLEIAALQYAVDAIVERHVPLRTIMPQDADGKPYQHVLLPVSIQIQVIDLSKRDSDIEIDEHLEHAFSQVFQMDRDIHCRAYLLMLGNGCYKFAFVTHHIASDGWSVDLLLKELGEFYNASVKGESPQLRPIEIDFIDYAVWEKSDVGMKLYHEGMKYWRSRLQDIPTLHSLPLDRPRPASQSFATHSIEHLLDATTLRKLEAYALSQGTTLFVVLMTAFGVLIYRYSREPDIVVGTPIANRLREELAPLIGLFVNVLANRMRIEGDETFTELLRRSQVSYLEDIRHQGVPFDRVVAELGENSRSTSYAPLVQIGFVLHNNALNEVMMQGLQCQTTFIIPKSSQYDLNVAAQVRSDGLHFAWQYAVDLFDATRVARMAQHFDNLLQDILREPNKSVQQLLLTDEHERRLLLEFSQRRPYPEAPIMLADQWTVIKQLESLANATPESTAVRDATAAISYGELNQRANQLAHYLREQCDIESEVAVGVAIPRSINAIVALFAVMKAGGVYVPLDSQGPVERAQFMARDAALRCVIVNKAEEKYSASIDVIDLSRPSTLLAISQCSTQDITSLSDAQQGGAAYVIYTSGSTGEPKGVVVEHAALNSHIRAMIGVYGVTPADRVMQFASLVFDASIDQIFIALCAGATLHLRGVELDTREFVQLLRMERITVADLPLAYAIQVLHELAHNEEIAKNISLRTLIVGGEAMPTTLVALAESLQLPQRLQLHNVYGPTEACVASSIYLLPKPNQNTVVPIGVAVGDKKLYVLNDAMQLSPVGVPGELYIGGNELARGYLNRPELTAQRFIPDSFASAERSAHSSRLYRSGDLVYWQEDGNLVFSGRVDQQVKIRGYRIEPGEIEAHLNRHPGVKESLVIALKDDHASRLVAYVVLNSATDEINPTKSDNQPSAPSEELLKHFLEANLPSYMVPSAFVLLTAFPVNAAGKINRRALPTPEESIDTQTYVAPGTATELVLCEIWQQVLGLSSIGVTDNFFNIGGDSIQAIQVIARASQRQLPVTTQLLFEHQNIRALARYIDEKKNRASASLGGNALQLFPAQLDLLLRGNLRDRASFQYAFIELSIAHDLQHCEAALKIWLQRHASLRTVFRFAMDPPQPYFLSCNDKLIRSLFDGSISLQGDANAIAEKLQASVNLHEGLLIKAALISTQQLPQRLCVIAHALLVDDTSWAVLIADLQCLLANDKLGEIQEIDVSEKNLVNLSQQIYSESTLRSVRQQREFWLSQMQRGAVDSLAMLRGENDMDIQFQAVSVLELDVEQTRTLLQDCNHAYGTRANELLFAALCIGLGQQLGIDQVTSIVEGRLTGEDMAGSLSTLFPLKADLRHATFGDCIKSTKELIRTVPQSGMGYELLRYVIKDIDILEAAQSIKADVAFAGLTEVEVHPLQHHKHTVFGDTRRQRLSNIKSQYRAAVCVSTKISKNGLIMEFSSNASEQAQSILNQLAIKTKQALLSLITHCSHATDICHTPSDFPLATVTQRELDEWWKQYPNISKLYAQTLTQQQMLYFSVAESERGAFCAQSTFYVEQLNPTALASAWRYVITRYDILRTAFVSKQQLVLCEVKLPLIELDWREQSEEERKQKWHELLRDDSRRSFDPALAPLIRITLVRLSEHSYQFLLTHHHMLLDGWCMPIVFEELIQFYVAETSLQPLPVLAPAVPYENYIAWLLRQDHETAREYWRHCLKDITHRTVLGIEKVTTNTSIRKVTEQLLLSVELTAALNTCVRKNNITLGTVVHSAWAYLLHRYSGDERVVFGSTISGRPADLPNVEKIVGLFINVEPVVINVQKDLDALDWLQQVHKEGLERGRYSYFSSLHDIQQCTSLSKGEELFDSLVVFESFRANTTAASQLFGEWNTTQGLGVGETVAADPTHYGLTMVVTPGPELLLRISYDTNKYAQNDVADMLSALREMLHSLAFANDNRAVVRRIPWMNNETRQHLLTIGNDTAKEFDQNRCVHHLFEAQASKTPDAIALIFKDKRFTYSQLNERANQLAHYLKDKRHITPDTWVAVYLVRSPELLISQLAIMKAGGAYLPLDPEYPAARLTYMLEDAAVTTVLTTMQAIDQGFVTSAQALCWDDDQFVRAVNQQPLHNIAMQDVGYNQGRNLAYVIYTSGSTGKPKGAMLEHQGLTNLLLAMQHEPGITAADRLLAITSNSFDIHTLEMYLPLICGATMVMAAKEEYSNPAELARLIATHHISIMQASPTMYLTMVELGWTPTHNMKCLCGGEALPVSLKNSLTKYDRLELWNMYGPTETSVWSSVKHITDNVVIGTPIANTTFYVLNSDLEPIPFGVEGQLFIGGIGLARGYLNKPDITNKAFIYTSALLNKNERVYRTGDCVKRLRNGEIEFIGRVDNQVKIRGFRIEIGEVVAALESLPQIKQAAVIARKRPDGTQYLAAYVITRDSPGWNVQHALTAMAAVLPEHMIPTTIEQRDAFPLTPNGKVDLRALASEDSPLTVIERSRAAPETGVQRLLLQVWSRLLGLDPSTLSIDDDLFDYAVDSMRVILFVGQLKKNGFTVTPKDVQRYRTIRLLATVLVASAELVSNEIYSGPAPLLLDQLVSLSDDRVWRRFYSNLVLDLAQPLDVALMQQSLEKLVSIHDLLRSRFIRNSQTWQLMITDDCQQKMIDVQHLSVTWKDTEAAVMQLGQTLQAMQDAMPIDKGPLIALRLLVDTDHQQKLLLSISHLVADGFSIAIVLEDLFEIYYQLRAHQNPQVQNWLPVTAWSAKYQAFCNSPEMYQQLDYWEQLPWQKYRHLPLDYPEQNTDTYNIAASSRMISCEFDAIHTRIFSKDAPQALGIAPAEMLILVVGRLLMSWGKTEMLGCQIVDMARTFLQEKLDIDFSRTVGAFSSTRTLFLEQVHTPDVISDIKTMYATLQDAPMRGAGLPLLKYAAPDSVVRARAQAIPLGEFAINYFGSVDNVLDTNSRVDAAIYPKPSAFMQHIESVSNNPLTRRQRVFGMSVVIRNQKLMVHWEYSSNLHQEHTVQNLVHRFKAEMDLLLKEFSTLLEHQSENVNSKTAVQIVSTAVS